MHAPLRRAPHRPERAPDQPRPFTADDYAARLERSRTWAERAGLAGVLVSPGPDLLYLTGYAPVAITERMTLLIVPVDGEATLIVPTLERPDAEAAVGVPNVALDDWLDGADPTELAAGLLTDGRYAISDSAWSMHLLGLQAQRPGAGFVSMTEGLPMLRAVKGPDEVERLAGAGAAADAAFRDLLGVRFAGRTENQIGATLAGLLTDHGHSQVDFTVVGSGPNGANPHHELSDRTIEDGDMVVLDFGGLKDGYGSDTTRTVHVGTITEEEQQVHDIVRAAQQAGFESVRVGATCQDVDRAARAVITEAGYGPQFIHRTGHGIGLTTHEPPYMIEGEEQPLEVGMCFSIEPGIYLSGRFGVRIEDIVTVTADGGRRLNDTPREVEFVE